MQLIELVKLIKFGQDSKEQLLPVVRVRINLLSNLLLDTLFILVAYFIECCLITGETRIVARLAFDFNHVLVVFVRFHQTLRQPRLHFFDLLYLCVRVLSHAFDAVVRHICSLLRETHVYQLELFLLLICFIDRSEVLLLNR